MKNGKIVFVSTHDPILALLGDRRIIIKNVAIKKIIETSEKEKDNLKVMKYIDNKMLELRNSIRTGCAIDWNIKEYFNLNEL